MSYASVLLLALLGNASSDFVVNDERRAAILSGPLKPDQRPPSQLFPGVVSTPCDAKKWIVSAGFWKAECFRV
jgi:hypothetical protein